MKATLQRNHSYFFYLGFVLLFYSFNVYADFSKGGDAYKEGDFKTAAEEFSKVAGKGDHRAMYALGSMYAAGHGVEQNYKEAYKWFSRAAKYGRPDAQYKLGFMYDEGIGVKQDYNRAGKYYTQSAKQGYALSQYKLGFLYSNGLGVKQNNVKAYAWLLTASQNLKISSSGNEIKTGEEEPTEIEIASAQYKEQQESSALSLVTQELDKLSAAMSLEEIEEANKLVQNYIQYR